GYGRPHARGGGPLLFEPVLRCGQTSPRTWGWTGDLPVRGGDVVDVPTHVGVDPHAATGRRTAAGRPHARGGGPPLAMGREAQRQTSPRTWGWTGPSKGIESHFHDVPTHVGVDRHHRL